MHSENTWMFLFDFHSTHIVHTDKYMIKTTTQLTNIDYFIMDYDKNISLHPLKIKPF